MGLFLVWVGLLAVTAVYLIVGIESQQTQTAPDVVEQLRAGSRVFTPVAWPSNSSEIASLLESVYDGVTGVDLSAADVALSEVVNGSFQKTYGEFAFAGVEVLLKALDVQPGDVFCDLGSGVGKVVMQAYLARKPAEAVGIELAEMRHRQADVARQRLHHSVHVPHAEPGESPPLLRFVHGDILALDSEVSRCNKIFFCSTVWPKELLAMMQDKLLALPYRKKPVLVASSRELKALGDLSVRSRAKGARFVEHKQVMTSWGASFISIYSLWEG